MRKKVIIIGIVIILITVGFSGCNDNDSNIISFQDLMNNPSQYYDQNITMKGYIGETRINDSGISYFAYFYDSSSDAQYVLVLTVPSPIEIHVGNYKITGTVKKAIYATPKMTVISAVPI